MALKARVRDDGTIEYYEEAEETSPPETPKVRYTSECRRRYNAYAKAAARKGVPVIDISKWAPINYPKGIVK